MDVSIALPEPLLERLQSFGDHGMTVAEITTRLMDRVQRDDFVAEMRHVYATTPKSAYLDLDDP